MTEKGLRITVETVAKLEEKLSGDWKYHIDGQLKLATGRQATKVMEKFLPILRRLKKNRKLILVPIARGLCLQGLLPGQKNPLHQQEGGGVPLGACCPG
jgi:hypothetical protein